MSSTAIPAPPVVVTPSVGLVLDPKLLAVGGAYTGIVPVNLLDIQDVNGNQYYFADRAIELAPAIPLPTGAQLAAQLVPIPHTGSGLVSYKPWLLQVPSFSFHRSLATDMGSFILQNLSGTTLARDMEVQLRASALQGAMFVYRCWQADAAAAWLEVHGTLSLDPGAGVDTVEIKGAQMLNPAQDDTPLEIYCETCQLNWGGPRCGSAQPNECLYSFQSCQVVERIFVTMNDFEKNYGETAANTPLQVINRNRRI